MVAPQVPRGGLKKRSDRCNKPRPRANELRVCRISSRITWRLCSAKSARRQLHRESMVGMFMIASSALKQMKQLSTLCLYVAVSIFGVLSSGPSCPAAEPQPMGVAVVRQASVDHGVTPTGQCPRAAPARMAGLCFTAGVSVLAPSTARLVPPATRCVAVSFVGQSNTAQHRGPPVERPPRA
jgi:hypothetical protein